MIKKELRNELRKKLGLENGPEFTLDKPPGNVPGDLGSNIAILLSRETSRSPQEVFTEISDKLSGSEIISRVERMGPGFVNFFISDKRLRAETALINSRGSAYPEIKVPPGEHLRILLEYVSSNPTGPLHIGHGRCAVIGDSLARILRKAGHEITREYYMNDTGTQISVLGESVRYRCLQLLGGKLTPEQETWIQEKGYRGGYIEEIARTISSENGMSSAADIKPVQYFAENACRIVMDMIRDDLRLFNSEFDNWVSERSLHDNNTVHETMKLLKEKGFTYEKDGAVWFKSSGFGDEKDRVVTRKTGENTYFANDVAYHRQKYQRNFDRIIDIFGADHHSSVVRVRAALKALGLDDSRLKVILYQFVSLLRAGKTVAMSTRSGKFITLREVIGEIGADACRYFLLTRSPDSHLKFDLELAKKQSPENPVYYIQYAHTRCCGILRQAEESGIPDKADYSLLSEDMEREVMKKLLFYPETIDACAKNLSPHFMASYLLELTGLFHRYYDRHRIITPDKAVSSARIALITAVRTVLSNGLSLLGISSPERM